MKKISLLLLLGVAAWALLAGCTPTPEAIVETVVVTEIVETEGEEVVVTQIVEVTPQPEAEPAEAAEEDWEDWETIKIGVPTLITGVGAPMGTDIMAGISMAVQEVNANGGLLGKPLEIVYADIKGSGAEDCALAAELMDRSGVVANFPGAFFGPACAHEFGRYDPPIFHGSASKETVDATVENFPEYRNVFQITASETTYGPNAYQVMTEAIDYEFPNNKVALLGGDISYDMLIQQSFRDIAAENGWEIVLDDTYPYGTTEFGAQLAKIRAEEPAIIFGALTSVDSSVAFMNQFLENPTNSLVYIQWSPASPEFISLLGDKANGVMWQTLVGYLPTEANEEWVQAFNAQFGRLPGATWPALMEDNLHIWMEAVETCESPVAYDCIYEYLENLSEHPYEGRTGIYGMDAERHEGLTGDEWLPQHFVQIQDEQNHVLFLGTQAVEGESFQVPPWITP